MAGVLSKSDRKKYYCILAILLLDEEFDTTVIKRSTRAWISRRLQQGAYQNLVKELQIGDMASYTNFFRMDRPTFDRLLTMVAPYIQKQDTFFGEAITPGERLAVTLRFLATGESFRSLQYQFRISERSISSIVKETSWYIYQVLKDEYLQMANTEAQWLKIARGFEDRWNLPHCVGALDGKHVLIKAPANSGSTYFNYKGTFSIILLAIVDSDYKFTYVDVGTNGRVADGGVFAQSSFKEALDKGNLHFPPVSTIEGTDVTLPYFLVADDAFPLREDLMKPHPQRNLTREQRVYNYRLSRARRVVENGFGILANRFRVFLSEINLPPDTVEILCLAACALHNMLRSQRSLRYISQDMLDVEHENGHCSAGRWRNEARQMLSLQPTRIRNAAERAKHVRIELTDYLNSDRGSVPWQEAMI